jgi:SSS family solute:Na+ symporter
LLPAKEEQVTERTRLYIIVLALLAFLLWVFNRVTLVGLLLVGYSGITQLFPGVVLSLRKRPPHALSVAIGIIVALVLLTIFAVQGTSVIYGANVGTVALAVNIVCLFVIDYFMGARRGKSSG